MIYVYIVNLCFSFILFVPLSYVGVLVKPQLLANKWKSCEVVHSFWSSVFLYVHVSSRLLFFESSKHTQRYNNIMVVRVTLTLLHVLLRLWATTMARTSGSWLSMWPSLSNSTTSRNKRSSKLQLLLSYIIWRQSRNQTDHLLH